MATMNDKSAPAVSQPIDDEARVKPGARDRFAEASDVWRGKPFRD